MKNARSGQQTYAPPATPKNAAPDQKILYANISKAQREVEQGGDLRVEGNRQDPYAARAPEAHSPGTAGPGAGTSYDYL
jgi:hypothetical protein